MIARIVSGPARGHRPDQKKNEGDDQEAPDGVDRGADAATDDDPPDEDRDDPEDDVPRGGRLTEAAAHLLNLRVAAPRLGAATTAVCRGPLAAPGLNHKRRFLNHCTTGGPESHPMHGYLNLHTTASTQASSQTCHVSVMGFAAG